MSSAALLSGLYSGHWSNPSHAFLLISIALIFCSIKWVSKPKFQKVRRVAQWISMFLLISVLLYLIAAVPREGSIRGFDSVPWWVPIHVTLILIGFASFALGFIFSAIYLLLRKRLKSRKLNQLEQFPALPLLDEYSNRTLWAGFWSLTMGLGLGFWGQSINPGEVKLLSSQNLSDPTLISSLLMWCWYGLSIFHRLRNGRGYNSAWFGIFGFLGVIIYLFWMMLIGSWHVAGVG